MKRQNIDEKDHSQKIHRHSPLFDSAPPMSGPTAAAIPKALRERSIAVLREDSTCLQSDDRVVHSTLVQRDEI